MKRQITFLRSTQSQANCATQGPGIHSGSTAQTINILSNSALGTSFSFAKQNVVENTSNTSNQQNIGASSSQSFQKKPIFMERYRQICFLGIPGYPNEIPKGLRDKVTKFAGNNAISGEQHLRNFFLRNPQLPK